MTESDPRTPNPPATDGRQTQFLTVITRDEATVRFRHHLKLEPLGVEMVRLTDALGRVLGHDVIAGVDVPGFDRSNVDGFAVQAGDTFGATEEVPRSVRANVEVLTPAGFPPSRWRRDGPRSSPPVRCFRAALTRW